MSEFVEKYNLALEKLYRTEILAEENEILEYLDTLLYICTTSERKQLEGYWRNNEAAPNKRHYIQRFVKKPFKRMLLRSARFSPKRILKSK